MKLGILAPFADDQPRGIGKSSMYLIRELSFYDGDFEILAPVIPKGANPKKFRLISMDLAPSRKRRGNIKRFFWQNFQLKGYEYLFSTSYESSLYFMGRQVITIHDVINLLFKDFRYPILVRFYYRFQNPLMLKLGAKVITPSEYSKSKIMEIYGLRSEDIGVVYLGIDLSDYHPEKDEGVLKELNLNSGEYILYVGDMMKRKNIELIVRALPNVKDKILVIVGTEFEKVKRELVDLAESLGVLNRMRFLGYVDERTLRVLYSCAHVFVYPSLMEGFGMPPLEASACGTPVIVSDIPVFRELYEGFFEFVKTDNPISLSEKINSFDDENSRRNMISRFNELFSRFSWKECARRTYELLRTWGFL